MPHDFTSIVAKKNDPDQLLNDEDAGEDARLAILKRQVETKTKVEG
jgi:ATP-binding cassette subfamily B (MDR/TAP) protein 1